MEVDEKLRSVIEGFKRLCKNIGGKLIESTPKDTYITHIRFSCLIPKGKYLNDFEVMRDPITGDSTVGIRFGRPARGKEGAWVITKEEIVVPNGVGLSVSQPYSRPSYVSYYHDNYGRAQTLHLSEILKADTLKMEIDLEEKSVEFEF